MSGSILSSNSRVAPAASAGSIWSIRSTSQMMSLTPAATARRTASPTDPATSTWLSLIIAASHSPMRWFDPPPMRTAYFSSWRNPGIVLRVSSSVQSGLSIARTYSATIVAMPERCWTVFRALRSAVSMARALPSSRIRSVPAATLSPSATRSSILISGSSARKKASATPRPATSIVSRVSMTPAKRAPTGITLSLVTSRPPPGSPSPRSSASVSRTKVSRSKPGRVNALTRNPQSLRATGGRAAIQRGVDRFVAALLAMTAKGVNARSARPRRDSCATPSPLRPNRARGSTRHWYAA